MSKKTYLKTTEYYFRVQNIEDTKKSCIISNNSDNFLIKRLRNCSKNKRLLTIQTRRLWSSPARTTCMAWSKQTGKQMKSKRHLDSSIFQDFIDLPVHSFQHVDTATTRS